MTDGRNAAPTSSESSTETPADPIPVILDVDTGVDDAYALMLAARSPRLDLRAVTCVSGNTPVDHVVANTAYVLDVLGWWAGQSGDAAVGVAAERGLEAYVERLVDPDGGARATLQDRYPLDVHAAATGITASPTSR